MKSEATKPSKPSGLRLPGPPGLPRGKSGDPDPTNRVIRVDRAIRCCELAVDQALTLYEAALIFLKEQGVGGGEDLALVPILAPGAVVEIGVPSTVSTGFRWAKVAKGSLRAGGFIAIGALLLDEIEERLGAAAFMEASDGIAQAIARATKTKQGPCEACMMRQALPQLPQRRRRRVVSSRS